MNKVIYTFIIISTLSSFSFAQSEVSLKFSGYFPASLTTIINGTPLTSATQVIARADYVAQSPFCRTNNQRSTKTINLPVMTSVNNTRYAFAAVRQLGPPCGFILVSLNFGLAVKETNTLLSGVLMTKGPTNTKDRQLPVKDSTQCTLDKYGGSSVVICESLSNGGPSYYLPEDWSVQNFQYNFLAKP